MPRRMVSMSLVAGLCGLGLLMGCSSDRGGDGVVSPPARVSYGLRPPLRPPRPKIYLDPAVVEPYEVDSVWFQSRVWVPGPPSKPRALFDVYYGARLPGDPEDRAADWQFAEIDSVCDTIAHEFNVPMIRAVLDTATVRHLHAIKVIGVPDAFAFPVNTIIVYGPHPPHPTESDIAALKAAGAVIRYDWSDWGTIIALVPDEAIPRVRALPYVTVLEGSYGGVLYDEGHPGPSN
jgi:hypothetical protein